MTISTLVVDASSGKDVTLSRTLTTSMTIANPLGGVNGQRMLLRLIQGGHGSNRVTWGTSFQFGVGLALPVLKENVGDTDLLGFIYDASGHRWVYVARGDHFNTLLPPGPWKARYPRGTWFIPQASRGPVPYRPAHRP